MVLFGTDIPNNKRTTKNQVPEIIPGTRINYKPMGNA